MDEYSHLTQIVYVITYPCANTSLYLLALSLHIEKSYITQAA